MTVNQFVDNRQTKVTETSTEGVGGREKGGNGEEDGEEEVTGYNQY